MTHRSFAVVAVTLGALAAIAGSPYRAPKVRVDVARLAAEVAEERDHVTAIELATWIKDREPGLRIVDLRPTAAFDADHVPSAEAVPLETIASINFDESETVVLY